ncbi:MAG TPA: hypothetical protein VNG12_17135, partial [Acidimicrobiales bacterium]|nr:hypothetical protein [Acidimicrobiales bacterium]
MTLYKRLRALTCGGRRHRARKLMAIGAAAVIFAPVAITLSTTGPMAGAAPSNINPNGVLKYGFDLNNQFSNDFDPATGENDCSYTVLQNIYQSVTAPGNFAISGGVAKSW